MWNSREGVRFKVTSCLIVLELDRKVVARTFFEPRSDYSRSWMLAFLVTLLFLPDEIVLWLLAWLFSQDGVKCYDMDGILTRYERDMDYGILSKCNVSPSDSMMDSFRLNIFVCSKSCCLCSRCGVNDGYMMVTWWLHVSLCDMYLVLSTPSRLR